ncbi:ATP synthase F1 subunit epsilon [Hydrogenibacillus schlegelii]|uniref:ATP synthase epsilon chain n=1 Tax=Hydrogenibacillus schlegelii TaxID=1484 RepID=A0A132N9E8_HYDSH|nr:ATP synthase F1 subunit epsilon [Hydrogenibacillus schlegelii]KWX06748.1 ATP synthase F1 subunit epsilon [Hydrogenibacillus schlegelii]MBT9282186.1 ATP synthase F1 subunit epsilon [Hydrogenibacillus schlegelii]OAR04211.1 ATP synthase F1 subunit epsilon [Hydrogenibacillus schlegelii]
MNTFRLEIVTPERKIFSDDVVFLAVRGVEGDLGIAAHHIPFVTALAIAPAKVTFPDGREKRIAVSGGFLEVRGTEATILAEAAELPEEIDLERARRAKARAEAAMEEARRRTDAEAKIAYVKAELALRRALMRLEVGGGDGA